MVWAVKAVTLPYEYTNYAKPECTAGRRLSALERKGKRSHFRGKWCAKNRNRRKPARSPGNSAKRQYRCRCAGYTTAGRQWPGFFKVDKVSLPRHLRHYVFQLR